MNSIQIHTLFSLGIAYILALLCARILVRWHIPKVTAYLLVGLFLGPSFGHIFQIPSLFSSQDLVNLGIFSQVALALIMLAIGSQFKGEALQRWRQSLVLHAGTETFLTLVLVAVATFTVNFYVYGQVLQNTNNLLTSSVYIALFVGIISMATAPAATLLVIREYESEGQITELVLALVGLNNLITILAFNVAAHFILQPAVSVLALFYKLFAPLLMGLVLGFIVSAWGQKINSKTEHQMLLIGSVLIAVGLCKWLHLDIFLSNFALGMTITNASPKSDQLLKSLKGFDYPLYVLFFILAGAGLHIDALGHLGLLGVGYIIMRVAGKLAGNWLGARFAGFGSTAEKYIGYTMLAQAGVAIGLAKVLAETWPEGGQMIETVILGSVVFFEVVGPLAVRYGLVNAGEVPLLTLLAKRSPENAVQGVHHVVEFFRTSLGIPVGHKLKSPGDIMVKHIMRKNVDVIFQETPFEELLRLIAHSRYDRFPVVNHKKEFLGLIDYRDIRDLVFDKSLYQIVVAKDLTNPVPLVVHPDQTIGEVLDIFKRYSDITYLPVVTDEHPRLLLGMVNQNDILATFRSDYGKSSTSH
ncbi:CBS domain-containing protein [candidate division KSB1 bacterium]|nr:CBS domain-containing protein [candidate division KSB1 bacterium]